MGRHVRTFGLVAQLAKPVAKTGRGVGLAEMSHEEGLDADRRRRVDDFLQLRMHWNFEVRFFAAFGLALVDCEHAIVDMLPPDPHHVAASLSGVKEESEGKSRLGADRMLGFEAPDMVFRPCLVARSLDLLAGDAEKVGS